MKNSLKRVSFEFDTIFLLNKINHKKIEIYFCFVTGPSTKAILYEKLNVKIERMSNVTHFILFKLTFLGAVIPSILSTIVNYFVYDLGDKSFVLPISVMYALLLYNVDFDGKIPETKQNFLKKKIFIVLTKKN